MTVFDSQQLPSERENTQKTSITNPNVSYSFSRVQEGLNFILGHFQEPWFPRKVSTPATRYEQKPVEDKDRAMLFYQGALWEDCRINAFRIDQENPDLILIDLDAENFSSLRSLKLALTKTLKNIKEKIGAHPSIIWSGRGYHVLLPIDCPTRLEDIKELAALEPNNTSNKFLQFCEGYLSAGRRDKSHHPALKSCQLRIPGSLNSKCRAVGADPEVKVLQRWDGHRPSYKLLLGSFYADLIGKNQARYRKYKQSKNMKNYEIEQIHNSGQGLTTTTAWIERLLRTPINDYRKRARDLILVPYLVVRRGMTDPEQIESVIMEWADRCAELRRLEPSRYEFVNKIHYRIDSCLDERVPPMKLSTLQERNPELYEKVVGGA